MEDENPVIHGLEFQARALASQLAETDAVRFLVGTQSLKLAQNQVHLVELDEERDEREERSQLHTCVFPHPDGEIWSITSSPSESNIISTCYNTLTADNTCIMRTSLWQLSETDPGGNHTITGNLEKRCTLDTESHGSEVKVTAFHPSDTSQVMSVVDNHFLLFDISGSEGNLVRKGTLEGKGQLRFMMGKWNPHHKCTQFVTANDCNVRSWDLREDNRQAWHIEGAHAQLVRDFDLNPNRQYYLATCGDDGCTKFWDVRNPNEPVISRSDHSHWVWAVRYNHFHDQLVLTSSSDARLMLTSIASISSEPDGPVGTAEDDLEESTKGKLADGILASYEQHEDSVYGVEWSAADPWTFASLSYDGRLVINKVPKSVKYKILL